MALATSIPPDPRSLSGKGRGRSLLPRLRPLVLLGFLAPAALSCSGGEANTVAEPARPPWVTVFLIDGLSSEIFTRELAAGNLPVMERMIGEGAMVEEGISAFPSMTGYGFYPFLTGVDASRSGIIGLRWFDRTASRGLFHNYVGRSNVRMNQDLRTDVLTLFERFPDAYSASINSYLNRGAAESANGGWSFSSAKYRDAVLPEPVADAGWSSTVFPDWDTAESRAVDQAIEQLARRPKIHWITLATPDAEQHIYGPDTPAYVEILHMVDGQIGRYRAAAESLGLEEGRVYAVVSDHGVAKAARNIDLASVLRGLGFATTRDRATRLASTRFDEPAAQYADLDAVVAINGNMSCLLYLRHPRFLGLAGWRHRPRPRDLRAYRLPGRESVDVIAALLERTGVEMVAARGEDGAVEIFRTGGWGRIEARGDSLRYTVHGEDPLGYAGRADAGPLLEGRFHPDREWLRATRETGFPDALHRMYRLFLAPGAADLVVTSDPGFDFGLDYELLVGNYRGGHGGIRRDQLVVPYILAGPGIEPGRRVAVARSEDVGATLMRLLGIRPDPAADGRVLPILAGEGS